jgi:hypothetical protein
VSTPPPSASASAGESNRASRGLLGELTVVLGVVTLLTLVLAVLFSSPDEKPSTIAQWSRQDPVGFVKTALSELGGSSATAEYGPPYNHGSDGQHAAFLAPQRWLGVSHPIDTSEDFVIGPLRTLSDPQLRAQISQYEGLPASSQDDGINNAEKVLLGVPLNRVGSARVAPSAYWPTGSLPWPGEFQNVDKIMRALLPLAQSGGLERRLLTDHGHRHTDYTKPLLLLTDGGVIERRASAERLPARQWATMDETGSYPGLPWLWPYAFWYQIEPFKSSPNADLLVWLVMAALALIFVCAPSIPRLRSIPRLVGHRPPAK